MSERALLWQFDDRQQEGELLMVLGFENQYPVAARIYHNMAALQADFEFWEPLLAKGLALENSTHLNHATEMVDNMVWLSDPSAEYCFQIFRSRIY